MTQQPILYTWRILLRSIVSCFIFMGFNNLNAQSAWELKKNKNGIRVYAKSADSSKYKKVKVECEFTGSLARFDSVMQDTEHHKEWVYSSKTSYRIKTIGEKEQLYYAETSMPWPMENRDVIIHMWINGDSIKNMIFVTTIGEPNAIPKKENIVRLPYLYGRYEVTQKENNRLGIVYYLDVDPGGSTPAWIVNLFVAKGPYETFSNLSSILAR